MPSIKNLAVVALAAAASATPVQDAAAAACPGTTTSTLLLTGPTATAYKSAFGDGVFVNCHGYTAISVKSQYKPAATTTTTITGGTTAVYMCSPTAKPSCPAKNCPVGALTTTTTLPGGLTATSYAFAEGTFSAIGCSGHSSAVVKTKLKVSPTATVRNPGTTGVPIYTCKPTPSCSSA